MDDINVLLLQATQGNVDAQRTLGEGYYFGDYGAVDYDKAWTYYSMAASQGDGHSLYSCGCMLFFGRGRNVDIQSALTYWKAAGETGNSYAFEKLAVCYEEGIGVAKDRNVAKDYWSKAADLGNPNALFNRAVDAHNMSIDAAKAGNWELFKAARLAAKNSLKYAKQMGSQEAENLLNAAYGGDSFFGDDALNTAVWNQIRGQ